MRQNKVIVNRLLASAGLGQLEDGAGLLSQLGYLVRDHEHFRQLLVACEPDQRVAMYEALRANLRFTPKALDVYMSEAGAIADARQWPLLDAATGQLRPHKPVDIRSDEYIAQQAVVRSMAKETLTLTCAKCTKVEQFHGERKVDAIMAAREAGWTYDELNGKGREICPECPAGGRVN